MWGTRDGSRTREFKIIVVVDYADLREIIDNITKSAISCFKIEENWLTFRDELSGRWPFVGC